MKQPYLTPASADTAVHWETAFLAASVLRSMESIVIEGQELEIFDAQTDFDDDWY